MPFFVIFLIDSVISSNILFIGPSFAPSHNNFYAKIADTLSQNEHNLTFLRPIYDERSRDKFMPKFAQKLIVIDKNGEDGKRNLDDSSHIWTTEFKMENVKQNMKPFMEMLKAGCDSFLSNMNLLEDLRNSKFDVAFVEPFDACGLGVIDYLGISKFILITSTTHFDHILPFIGEPLELSYVPSVGSLHGDKMTIWQRYENWKMDQVFSGTIRELFDEEQTIYRERLGQHLKSWKEILPKASLVLTNSNPILDFPRPILHKTIAIGGISYKKSEILEKEWNSVLQLRPRTIIISFGSMAQSSQMPKEWRKSILDVITLFPDVTFIWKYEKDDVEWANLAGNIRFAKWIPQSALLGDRRLAGIVSHAGLSSVIELAYSGKPAILIPLFGDQFRNSKMMARHGSVEIVEKFRIASDFKIALESLLRSDGMLQNARNLSRKLQNQPFTPNELLLKWTSFVAEFGPLDSLDPKSARNLNFLQKSFLDVYGIHGVMPDMTILDNATINACGLSSLLRQSPKTTLIVDCRGFTEFNESHVRTSVNAFFSKLIRRRLFENKLDDSCLLQQLTSHSAVCREMSEKLDVVLYGDEEKPRGTVKRRNASYNGCENSSKILKTLRDRLEETQKFRAVMVLEGGYKKFESQYPQLCEASPGMNRIPQSFSQPCLSIPNGDGITKITPFIYLGSQIDSLDENMLKALDITSVINLSVTCPKSVCIKDEKNFMRIPVNDSYQEKLYPYFPEAYEFLESVRMEGKKCLIHCLAGISRSPTLCISYIMKHKKMSSDEAYRYVKNLRPSISPNFNFMGQLLEYENQLIKENVLRPEQASRPYRNEKTSQDLLCPPKVPKSVSSVFTPTPEASNEESMSDAEPSATVNENGKRSLTEMPPCRPKALGISNRKAQLSSAASVPITPDVPSPSSEFSRLSFEAGIDPENQPSSPSSTASSYYSSSEDSSQLAYTNPCFVMSRAPTKECGGIRIPSALVNPVFCDEANEPSGSGSRAPPNFRFKKFVSRPTSRPECLRSSGVILLQHSQLPATTEETESPESGFNESCVDDDRKSISSTSSLEISCK
ncbi:unnamed protein product [Caenorhabditis bovis]|uniref:Glucuronosyltransferase n=1 Tax=Caenorhabditis bovis TaxID=2654633 RepID=A0A8S1F4J8_9PELO|nr:unnamed protein product [Caenorhabditis bovis]